MKALVLPLGALGLLVAGHASGRPPYPARPALIEQLASPSAVERTEATETMGRHICWQDHVQMVDAALNRASSRKAQLALLKTMDGFNLYKTPPLPGLVKLLSHPDLEIRLQTIHIVGKAGSSGAFALAAVLPNLRHPDMRVQCAAAKALSYHDPIPEPAVPLLGELLKTSDQEVRLTALGVILRVKSTSAAVAGLLAVLADPEGDVRSRRLAARALGHSGAPQAVRPLAALLATPEEKTRRAAAQALASLAALPPGVKTPDLKSALHRAHDDLDRQVKLSGARGLAALGEMGTSVATLRRLLFTRDRSAQTDAISLVAELGPAAAAAAPELMALVAMPEEYLIETMPSDGREQRRDAAEEALKKMGRAAVPAIRPYLRSPDERTRERALGVLASLGSEGAPAQGDVVPLLRDREEDVRATAIWALAKIGAGDRLAVGRLADRLLGKSERVSRAAAAALGELGPNAASAGAALGAALTNKNVDVAVAAADALIKIGEPARGARAGILRALRDPRARVRLGAAHAAIVCGVDVRAGMTVLEAGLGITTLTDADRGGDRYANVQQVTGYLRSEAARRLAAVADHPEAAIAVAALARALRDSDYRTKGSAAEALDRLGPRVEPVLGDLIAVLGDEQKQPYGQSSAALCRAIGRFGARASAALPALVEVFFRSGHCSEDLLAVAREAPGDVVTRLKARFGGECPGRYGRAEAVVKALGATP